MNGFRDTILRHPLLFYAVIGICIRLAVAPFFSHVYDSSSWAINIENIRAGEGLYDVPGHYYFPAWGYYLCSFSLLLDQIPGIGPMISAPEELSFIDDVYERGTVTTILFNVIQKIPLIIIDIFVALMVRRLVVDISGDGRKADLAFVAWMLMPIAIIVSGVYGMFDSLVVLFVLFSLHFLRKGNHALSGIALGIGFALKLFPVLAAIPAVAYILSESGDLRRRVRDSAAYLAGVFGTFLVLLVPQVLEGTTDKAMFVIMARLTEDGTMATFNMMGVMITAGLVVAIPLMIWVSRIIYRRCDRFEGLVVISAGAIGAASCASLNPQYIAMFLPLLLICMFAYGYRLKEGIVLMNILAFVRVFIHLPLYIVSTAYYTDLVDLETVKDLMYTALGDGPGHALNDMVYQLSGDLLLVTIVVVFLLLLTRILKMDLGKFVPGRTRK